jgi:guanylate kinase
MGGATSGRLVVISGPSGSGKTSVVQELRSDPRVVFSVSATTRPMRPGERAGWDYHFLTPQEFERRIAAGEFLEWARYDQSLYGTLRRPLDEALAAGKTFVLEIEVQGTRQLRAQRIPGLYLFLVPPSLEALRARLGKRGHNSAEQIEARIRIAEQELQCRELYDHVIVNEDLPRTVAEVRRLIGL